MSDRWSERIKLAVLFMNALTVVIALLSHSEIRAVVSSGWTWFYLWAGCYGVFYVADV